MVGKYLNNIKNDLTYEPVSLVDLVRKYDLEDHVSDLEIVATRCLESISSSEPGELGCTKIGGLPHVPRGFEWPRYLGVPLDFILQIKLDDSTREHIPQKGLLLIFYAEGGWVEKKEHLDCLRVIHVKDEELLEIARPPFQYEKRLWGLLKPRQIPHVYKEERVGLRVSLSFPDLERRDEIPELSKFDDDEALMESYYELKESLTEERILQIGGYPNPIQYDGLAKSAATIMEKGSANDWILLLEINSGLEFNWGDAGRLYFYIHKDDLDRGDFSEVWLEYQCY